MRTTAELEDVAALVLRGWGTTRPVTGVERLRGGTKKGVYRVHLQPPGVASVILYSWADDENFWPTTQADADDPFAPATGLQRFLDAQRMLAEVGVRAPRVLWSDDTHEHYPADVAVVEDLLGGTLEALYDRDPDLAEVATQDLARSLARMHARRASTYGTLDQLQRRADANETTCELGVLTRARNDLRQAAAREPRLHGVEEDLARRLHELHARIAPRQEYALIHGELGPDHVMVDERGQVALIDIEGLLFYDVEWEHVFLEIRFRNLYPLLAGQTELDERRLDLYRLAMRLSLVAGPLRLLEGDFPHRQGMLDIAEQNTRAALTLLEA